MRRLRVSALLAMAMGPLGKLAKDESAEGGADKDVRPAERLGAIVRPGYKRLGS